MSTLSPGDYRQTLFLPRTTFPMRAGLPKKEPEILEFWQRIDLYRLLRQKAAGRPRFILHDGPPYANGHLHIGHAFNKILKDMVVRSRQMAGYDANYVPGWDCHGLPIEWKVEERYRAQGKSKDDIPINAFRAECRSFAKHWLAVQTEEFIRLGVVGDFVTPYLTMAHDAEAVIAGEIMRFAISGQLYRGSKPVMWSVVEQTALAEAEVEYLDYESDTVWVTFPVASGPKDLAGSAVLIWTTTPWTLPGNRAISYSPRISYGLYEVTQASSENWLQPGDRLILADKLAEPVMRQARAESYRRLFDVGADRLETLLCAHPLAGAIPGGYDFAVPLLAGDHVTDDEGTGFVHTAPGHGREDFEIWMENARQLEAAGISAAIPFTVDGQGALTAQAPGFTGKQVITAKGEKGPANAAVIAALQAAGQLAARSRLKHKYPHSWRSKKPVIFRNTPQWFIHMDKPIDGPGDTLRTRALKAVAATQFFPGTGQNRLKAMIENRPDWVLSRQRAWGVPIAVFANEDGEILKSETVNGRILDAFSAQGADAWFAEGAAQRFLGDDHDPGIWKPVTDIVDVWFDSGCTHAFCLEKRPDLQPKRGAGGEDCVMYLEGTDQHRGWFQSSLLESCGTRGRAPFDTVLTHGFVMDESGRKMSKSLGNIVTPQNVTRQFGADILRLWVATSDYADDLRLGPEITKSNADAYRKLRNGLRYLLGALHDYDPEESLAYADMPELERYILHLLNLTGQKVARGYEAYDYKAVTASLINFMTADLSAFYFDIRKDSLYCDPPSFVRQRACRLVMDRLFRCLTTWLAPILCFTTEEAWRTRFPGDQTSVHLEAFAKTNPQWHDGALAEKWAKLRKLRAVITGALEVERSEGRLGSSLEAAPAVHVTDPTLAAIAREVGPTELADIAITSAISLETSPGPQDAFRLEGVTGVAVVPARARGKKCARSWRVSPEVGRDPEFPDITPRDARAVREWREKSLSQHP